MSVCLCMCVSVFQLPRSSQPSYEAPESAEECSKVLQSLSHTHTQTHTSTNFLPILETAIFLHPPQQLAPAQPHLTKPRISPRKRGQLILNGQIRLLDELLGHTDLPIFRQKRSGLRFIDCRLSRTENTDKI